MFKKKHYYCTFTILNKRLNPPALRRFNLFRNVRFIYIFVALAGLLARSAAGQAPTNERPVPVLADGLWKGPLRVPGGVLEAVFRFVHLTSGAYFGTLDVPLQKVSHVEVQVAQSADTVRFSAPAIGSCFTGVFAGGQQLVGVWQQPGFQVEMTLTFAAAAAGDALKRRLPPPYREEEIAFPGAFPGPALAGTLTVPPGPGPFPGVVLAGDADRPDRNGSGPGAAGYAPLGALADYLTRRGVMVLRYDERGYALRNTPGADATLPELVDDALQGLALLRTRPEADPARLGLVGYGEGGNVALLAAAQPEPPAFVVALAAAGLPGQEVLLQQQRTALQRAGRSEAQVAADLKRRQEMFQTLRRTPDNALAQVLLATLLRQGGLDATAARRRAAEMTTAHYRYALDFDPLAKLSEVDCPVLLLHGTDDGDVNDEANLGALARGLKSARGVRIKKLPGVNHLFQSSPGQWPIVAGKPQATFSPLAEETIRAWLVEQTTKGVVQPAGKTF